MDHNLIVVEEKFKDSVEVRFKTNVEKGGLSSPLPTSDSLLAENTQSPQL